MTWWQIFILGAFVGGLITAFLMLAFQAQDEVLDEHDPHYPLRFKDGGN